MITVGARQVECMRSGEGAKTRIACCVVYRRSASRPTTETLAVVTEATAMPVDVDIPAAVAAIGTDATAVPSDTHAPAAAAANTTVADAVPVDVEELSAVVLTERSEEHTSELQ